MVSQEIVGFQFLAYFPLIYLVDIDFVCGGLFLSLYSMPYELQNFVIPAVPIPAYQLDDVT